MRCLLRYDFVFFEVLYFLSLMSVSIVEGHVGEKCSLVILFRMCMASNAYCDKNNICQCKPDYPVKVDAHTCKKPRRFGERCSVNAECIYLDSNSYCTQLSYRSVCECHDGYRHDSTKDICRKEEKEKSTSTNLALPMAVGLSLSVACLICCCLASVHFCRARRRRSNRRSGSRVSSAAGHRSSDMEGARWMQRLPSTPSAPEDIGTLPPYDLAVTLPPNDVAVTLQPIKDQDMVDELPPSYDEVMKDSLTPSSA